MGIGNALRSLYHICCDPRADQPQPVGPHGVYAAGGSAGVSALAHDILLFESTSQVPAGLSQHVVSSVKAQANWYGKLLQAWKEAKHPPKTPEEASQLVTETLKGHRKADVEGLLAYYGLAQHPSQAPVKPTSGAAPSSTPPGAKAVKYELNTLPVDAKAVADGDTVTVYVSAKDPRESNCVPKEVQTAAVQRAKARAVRDYTKADALHKKIIDAGYRVLSIGNEEVLARKYRIRLSGIDAPESSMPYGKQAKEELTKLVQGKCLRVLVYAEDRYGRAVGDIYCNGVFVQECMLKKGLVWHYAAYDKRSELANVSSRRQYIPLVGEGGSCKAGWFVGFIQPRRTMGMEKGSPSR